MMMGVQKRAYQLYLYMEKPPEIAAPAPNGKLENLWVEAVVHESPSLLDCAGKAINQSRQCGLNCKYDPLFDIFRVAGTKQTG